MQPDEPTFPTFPAPVQSSATSARETPKTIETAIVKPVIDETFKVFAKMRDIWDVSGALGSGHRIADHTPLRNALPGKEPTVGDVRKAVAVIEQLFGTIPVAQLKD